jgi:hypothetical protein
MNRQGVGATESWHESSPERQQDLRIEQWSAELPPDQRAEVQDLLREERRQERKPPGQVRLGFDPAAPAGAEKGDSTMGDDQPSGNNRRIVGKIRNAMRRRLAEAGMEHPGAQDLVIRLLTQTTWEQRAADPDTYSYIAIAAALNEATQEGYSVDSVRYLLFDVAGGAWLEAWVEVVRSHRRRVEAQGRDPDVVIGELLEARKQLRESRLRSWSHWGEVVQRVSDQCN